MDKEKLIQEILKVAQGVGICDELLVRFKLILEKDFNRGHDVISHIRSFSESTLNQEMQELGSLTSQSAGIYQNKRHRQDDLGKKLDVFDNCISGMTR